MVCLDRGDMMKTRCAQPLGRVRNHVKHFAEPDAGPGEGSGRDVSPGRTGYAGLALAGTALAISAGTFLAGCGGHADEAMVARWNTPTLEASAQLSQETMVEPVPAAAALPPSGLGSDENRRRALRATVVDATADTLFDWAERTYPALFPGHSETLSSPPYLYRHYPATGIYIGVRTSDVYLMGGSFGSQPIEVGTVASFWSQAVTKSPESDCWNLDLMFTEGSLIDVDWVQTGANVRPQGNESLQTVGPSLWQGRPATEFWSTVQHEDAKGYAGRTGRLYMQRTANDEVTWLAEVYTDAELVAGVGVRNQIGGIDSAVPQRVDRHYGLAPGQSSTSTYTLSRMVTTVGATPAENRTQHLTEVHSVSIRFVARESVVVPAGRYDTCRIEQRDTSSPGRVVTTWYSAGRGIPVQRVTVDNGITVMTQRASALRVNQKRV